jgi:trk system potassium uptake protein TrkH
MFNAARHAFFQTVSIKSTTGFCSSDFDIWPDTARFILLMLMIVGGCGGSTTGGLKHARVILLIKYSAVQIKRTLFPHSLSNVTLNGARVESETLHKVLAFFFIYFVIMAAGALILCTQPGNDLLSSISASISCIGSIGPGLAKVGAACTYSWMSDLSKAVLAALMLLGRLEIFTLMVIFLPTFWKK